MPILRVFCCALLFLLCIRLLPFRSCPFPFVHSIPVHCPPIQYKPVTTREAFCLHMHSNSSKNCSITSAHRKSHMKQWCNHFCASDTTGKKTRKICKTSKVTASCSTQFLELHENCARWRCINVYNEHGLLIFVTKNSSGWIPWNFFPIFETVAALVHEWFH